jgi:hypothetical protein
VKIRYQNKSKSNPPSTPAPTLPAIEARFKGRGPWKKSLPTLLQTLEALGRAQAVATDGEVAWRG